MNTVLVIEDNFDVADNIADILRLAGYDVIIAANGKIGMETILERHPDLIICDVMMPELDGYGVRHLLNQRPETADIPFIFLTAKSNREDLRTGMNLGADDYLTKPFDSVDLLRVVDLRLKKSVRTRENRLDDAHTFLGEAKERGDLQKISEKGHNRKARKREFLFLEGQPLNDLYLIQDGKIKTYKSSPDGKELITGFHGKGDFLGYAALVENKPSHETAVVAEDAAIVMIPKQDFLTMIFSNREMARKFIQLLSTNLVEAENRLLHLAYQSVRQRVAGTLLELQADTTTSANNLITISRKDISSIVGTATESLNRMLADFKEEGLLELEHHGIRLLDSSKLEKIARQ